MKKPLLFVLHFAGGNKYSFQFLKPYLNNFNVIPLELPGRGSRMKENLLLDFENAIEDYYQQIIHLVQDEDFIIYGHSMGASLGLIVTKRLEEAGIAPKQLIVSGNCGPGIKSERKPMYLMQDEEFNQELVKLGGIPKEIMENEELYTYFSKIIRADFEVIEKNPIAAIKKINTPIYALMGDQERFVGHIKNWENFTNSHFDYQILEGNHFFIYEHPKTVSDILNDCYTKMV